MFSKWVVVQFELAARAGLVDFGSATSRSAIDFDSYNDYNHLGAKLDEMDFDLNKDLAELLASGEWPEEPTVEDDGDDD